MTYEALTPMPSDESEAVPVTIEKQKELAAWSVGRTREEIEAVAEVIGRDASSIYAWREKYQAEMAAAPPPEPEPEPEPAPEPEPEHQTEIIDEMAKEQTESSGKKSRRNVLTKEIKESVGKWAVGKTWPELQAKGKELGVTAEALHYLRKKHIAGKPAGPSIRKYSAEDKARIVAEYNATPEGERMAWLRAQGLSRTTIFPWLKGERTGDSRPAPRGKEPWRQEAKARLAVKAGKVPERFERAPGTNVKRYTEAFKRYAVAREKEVGHQRRTELELGLAQGDISRFKRELASGVMAWKAQKVTKPTVSPKKPSPPSPRVLAHEDQELLESHEETRIAKRESKDELSKLRKELVVKNALLQLAYEQGFLSEVFNAEVMFKRRG